MAGIFLLILLLIAPVNSRAQKKVTMVLDDAPVVQVLQALAENQQLNLLIAPGVEGQVSLHLVDVPWKQAFQLVLNTAELTQLREGNVLHVMPKVRQQQIKQLQEQQRKQQALNRPLHYQVISPRYANATELAAELKATGEKWLVHPNGSVTIDKRTNRLIVRESKEVLQQITEWVKKMDIPLGQVEIAAHIVTINREKLRELGVKWSAAQQSGADKLHQLTGIGAEVAVGAATARVGFNIARIDGRLLELELSALEQQQELEIIASPRLMAAHLQPASIKQGTEIPYQVSSGESGATSIEFKEAVLGMEVTPTIQSHGNIGLKLRISQNRPGRAIRQADGEALAIDKQEIETVVAVKNGETLALGGIFQQYNENNRDSVPLLGDIPLLGHVFRHDAKNQQRRELVVFITPRIIPVQ